MAASGFFVARALPPSACTIITDREWATMSCSSRAMSLRVRSSAMRAACSRSARIARNRWALAMRCWDSMSAASRSRLPTA